MDDDGVPFEDMEASEDRDDADLWFLPGPMEDEPDYLPPGPASEPKESDVVDAWRAAEAGQAAKLLASRPGWGSSMSACAAARLAGGTGLP